MEKLKNQWNLSEEITVDNFAGGGGASIGIELGTGRPVNIAINHDYEAIRMHEINHPHTNHFCESVWDVDPLKVCNGRPVGLAWFSPDCKHHSKARGGKPVEKSIRGLAWVAVKWAGKIAPRVIILENVEEFQQWGPLIAKRDSTSGRVVRADGSVADPGEVVKLSNQMLVSDKSRKGATFKAFVNNLRAMGYAVEWKELRACDYGAATIRKRLFLIARNDGRPIVWPAATHGHKSSPAVIARRQKPYKTAADIIDWSIPCPSIFTRKKPLALRTCQRIAKGIQKFVLDRPEPFIIKLNHGYDHFRGQSINDPLQTVTSIPGFAVVAPSFSQFNGQSIGREIDKPLPTLTTLNKAAVIAPLFVTYNGPKSPGDFRGFELSDPIPTQGCENRFAMVAAFMAQHNGGVIGRAADDPLSTVTVRGTQQNLVTSHLVKLRGTCQHGQGVEEPLPTIMAGGTHIGEVRTFLEQYGGLGFSDNSDLIIITINGIQYAMYDIGMRMLAPAELYAAHGFPTNFIFDRDINGKPITKTEQVAKVGNSVPPPFAEALTRANAMSNWLDCGIAAE